MHFLEKSTLTLALDPRLGTRLGPEERLDSGGRLKGQHRRLGLMKPNLEIAIIGLVGVVVGAVVTAGLTMIREWMSERKEQKKNSEYLAILVSSMLDMYVAGCAEVVSDDGLCHGERNADGYREIHSTAPSFEPLSVQVEWKSLPSKLMNEVLSFPLEIEAAKSRLRVHTSTRQLHPTLMSTSLNANINMHFSA